jgi:hypothetical protein
MESADYGIMDRAERSRVRDRAHLRNPRIKSAPVAVRYEVQSRRPTADFRVTFGKITEAGSSLLCIAEPCIIAKWVCLQWLGGGVVLKRAVLKVAQESTKTRPCEV